MIEIRQGEYRDIEAIMSCYDKARHYMRENGNNQQWVNGYPSRELVRKDIDEGVCYVGEDTDGDVVMAFAFIIGADPTYTLIEDGEWLNDLPYGTIHRLGSTGKYAGMLRECVEFCFTKVNNLRLDTHIANLPMRQATERLGFIRCGVIYCQDGTAREAYQLIRN